MHKILIVDDSEVDRLVIRQVLEQENYQIKEIADPKSIFETVREFRPDLILLDIVMPEMNGYEVCRRLKRRPETADIPVIFLSSRTRQSDIIWGKYQGAIDYICKPFESSELIRVVSKWLPHQSNTVASDE